ncbi:MAG TPA: DUF4340 domain-containing protein [Verrucomicrobiae bacterium]|jgi:hypothetical protein|nr:DUF4340 domain-containing protein [Verrucomicrobiae bacterium]
MNRKQFVMVLVALAIVVGAGLVLAHRNRQVWTVHEARAGDKVLPEFQINDVAVIHIRGEGEDFNVVHTNDLWRVRERDDYPAEFALIRDFLFKVRDLKVVQSDLIGPSELARLDLDPPGTGTNSATLLEFKNQSGKILASLLIGKRHLRPQNPLEPPGLHGLFDGRYVLLSGDPDNALLVSDDLAAASPDPGNWLSQDFFKAENIKYLSLNSPKAGESWEISRADESSPWTLSNAKPGESLNGKVISDITEILAFPTFDDVARKTPELMAGHGLDKPIVITAMTDHFAYTLKVGPMEANGDYPITVNVQGNIPDTDPNAAALRAKLAKEQALVPWIFDAGTWIGRIMTERMALVERTAPGTQTAEK